MRKLTTILLVGTMFLLGAVPVLAITGPGQYEVWATPAEYEKATGKKIEKYNEAPELRTLVAAGELPAVEERLPKEPLVVRGFDGKIGRYGGTLTDLWVYPGSNVHGMEDMSALIQGWFPFQRPYPNVAKSFNRMDTRGTEWVIELREGMKWSDGHPFTADDLVFAFKDIFLNKELTPVLVSELVSGDEVATIEKIDDYTVKYHFPKPYPFTHFSGVPTGWFKPCYPKHYLKQFHPLYTDKDELEKLVKEEGFGSWTELIDSKMDIFNSVGLPTLKPWVLVQGPPDVPTINKRNPYYWVVDEKGNQLPYIDETHYSWYDQEVVNLKALAGELDYSEALALSLYPEFKKAEKEGKIKPVIWALPEPNTNVIHFNLTVEDPVKREIFRDKRFRFAVSYSINREMVNELVYLGICQPSQVAPSETSPFYDERLTHTAIEYDPAKTSALLDEIGLDKRGADGFRLAPNGEKLQINFLACPWDEKFAELAIDMLKAVGLNSNVRIVDFGTLNDKRTANAYDAAFIWEAWGTEEGIFLADKADDWVPTSPYGCFWCPEWNSWYLSRGEMGEKPIPEVLKAIEYYEKAKNTLDLEEQKKWFGKVLDIAADNLWTIGTLSYNGGYPYLMAINPKLRNFPTSPHSWWYGDWGRQGSWFFEE